MTFVSLVLIQFFKAYNYRSDRLSVSVARSRTTGSISRSCGSWCCSPSSSTCHGSTAVRHVQLQPRRLAAGHTLAFTVVPVLEAVKWMERHGWFGESYDAPPQKPGSAVKSSGFCVQSICRTSRRRCWPTPRRSRRSTAPRSQRCMCSRRGSHLASLATYPGLDDAGSRSPTSPLPRSSGGPCRSPRPASPSRCGPVKATPRRRSCAMPRKWALICWSWAHTAVVDSIG